MTLMNISRTSSNIQGKFPKRKRGAGYRQSLEALFLEGIQLSVPKGLDIISTLSKNNRVVVIGGVVVGCHTGRPRATQDIDVIVDKMPTPAALKKVGALVDARTMERHPSFLSFIVSSVVGDREVVDIITSKSGSYGMALRHTIDFTIGDAQISVPTPEMMIILKYTAAVNPIRSKAKQMQDWADLLAIYEANPGISVSYLEKQADSIVPGYGQDLRRKLQAP
jgi:hypothetical protein